MDVRTLLYILAVTMGVTAIVTIQLSRSTRLPGVREWGVGAGCVSFGVLLIALRGHIHDMFSIILANELILLGYAVVWGGMRRFFGRGFSWAVTLISVLVVGGCFVGFYVYTFLEPSLLIRTILVSMAILFFSTAVSLSLSAGNYGRNWVTFTGAMYGVNCIVCALRVLHSVMARGGLKFIDGGPVTIFIFSFAIFFSIAVLIGQIFMVKEELGGTNSAPPISQLLFSSSR